MLQHQPSARARANKIVDQRSRQHRARRADRVPFAFEAARRIYGDAAANDGVATLSSNPSLARRHEAQSLNFDDLAHRRRVVHFRNVDV